MLNVKLVVDPPICSHAHVNSKVLKQHASIQIALILKCIWSIINQVMHSRININILAILKALDFRILEHFNILLPNINEDAGDPVWEAPPPNVIKINPVNIGPSIRS